jgi:hypothetical protein
MRLFLKILLPVFLGIWMMTFSHIFAYFFLLILFLPIAALLLLTYEVILDLSTGMATKKLWLYKILLDNMFRIKMDDASWLILKFNKEPAGEGSNEFEYFYTLQSSRGHYFFRFSSESTRNTLVDLLEKHVKLRFAANY